MRREKAMPVCTDKASETSIRRPLADGKDWLAR
jgi:hypothetical protein